MSIAEAAKRVYEQDLKARLEAECPNQYLAIEPESRAHFIGTTFLQAALAAKQAYPERKSFVLRIGRDAAFHLGASSS